MNFLAHLYLSGEKPAHRAGGFLADFIKGASLNDFPADIQQGVWLHRQIDTFTDSHYDVQQAVSLLKPALRRYAGVAIDILFDHLLAKDFEHYTSRDLTYFVAEIERQISEQLHYFPARAQVVWSYCVNQQWLINYAHWSGIERSFQGMARRTGQNDFVSSLPIASEILPKIHQHFDNFWPQLFVFSQKSLVTLSKEDVEI